MSRRLALVVGNSEYQDAKLARLRAPGEDVNDLADVLRAPEIGGFDEVTTLFNASAPEVRRAVARFFNDKRPDDLLLLYFSGHGVRDDHGRLFLAVQDTEYELLNATAIPAIFITEEMDRSRSRRQVLILDCCHSGAFAQGAKGAPGQSVGTAAAFEGTGYGRVVLTATDSTQFAWEGERLVGEAENSVFTQHVLNGLSSGAADTDGDGRITLDELYDYVYEQVVRQTPKQTPRKFAYNQQGEVVLARNPRAAARPAALPPDLVYAVASPLAGVREGVVRELEQILRGAHPGLAAAAREALERLAADDSRRVSLAAQASLDAHPVAGAPSALRESPAAPVVHRPAPQTSAPPAPQPEVEKPPAPASESPAPKPTAQASPPPEPSPAAASPTAAQPASASPRTTTPKESPAAPPAQKPAAQAGPPPAATPAAVRPTAAQPASAPPKGTPSPAAARRSAEQTTPGKVVRPPPPAPQPAAAPTPAAVPELAVPPAVAVLLVAAGCAVAWSVGKAVYGPIYGATSEPIIEALAGLAYSLVASSLSGLALGLVLRLRRPALPLPAALGLAAAWSGAALAGWLAGLLMYQRASEAVSQFLGLGLAGWLGGLALAHAMQRSEGWPPPRSAAVLAVAGGWAVALAVTVPLNVLLDGSAPALLLGAVAGALGGGFLFWLLGRGAVVEYLDGVLSRVLAWPIGLTLLVAAAWSVTGLIGGGLVQWALGGDNEYVIIGGAGAGGLVIYVLSSVALVGVARWVGARVSGARQFALAVVWGGLGLGLYVMLGLAALYSLPLAFAYPIVIGLVEGLAVVLLLGPALGPLRGWQFAALAGAWALASGVSGFFSVQGWGWTGSAVPSLLAALGSLPLFWVMGRGAARPA